MKKIFLSLLILISAKALHAQNDYNNSDENGSFKKENVFVGGSISLNFGTGFFGIGANPEVGYSVAQWLDAGMAVNLNYTSQRLYASDGYNNYDAGKQSAFNYGVGVFGRVYPIPFLFIQAQPEINWISYKQKDNITGISGKTTVSAPSLIGGIGYSQRVVGQASTFFMIGLDLINDVNSPYNDGYGHAQPIIRGGFDVYLHPSRKPRPVGNQL